MTTEEMGVVLSQNINFLYQIAQNFYDDVEAIRDLVQDTCLHALESAHRFIQGKVRNWLKVMMKHVYIDQYRRTHLEVENIDIESFQIKVNYDVEKNIDDAIKLRYAFANLQERDRKVLLMLAQNSSVSQIAEMFGVNKNTAVSYIHRARERAKKHLRYYET